MQPSPPRLPLANTPTPLQVVHGASKRLGLHLRVKRDDLTGSHLTGNKIRKLEFLLAEALERGATHVVTCGGIQSNHCRATAMSAVPLGLEPVLLLRTPRGEARDLPRPATGNVLLDRVAGATLHLCDHDGYRHRHERMRQISEGIAARGGTPYVIPEGGSNALGSMGYVTCLQELSAQWGDNPPSSIIVATGSGGTLAGLTMGVKQLGVNLPVIGIAVCDDAAYFQDIAVQISREGHAELGLPLLEHDEVRVVDRFKGVGYAKSQPHELELLIRVAREDGLILDPVYTGKAWVGLEGLIADQPDLVGTSPIFLHTGGAFGLMAAGESLEPHLT